MAEGAAWRDLLKLRQTRTMELIFTCYIETKS